jgi:RNA polymerase sigma-70 factor (ECF subfamily)
MATLTEPEQIPDPACWLEEYGDYLYSYAFTRIRDASLAEDVVQETLLSAYRNRARFQGKAKFRTWLTAILKRRIADTYRRRGAREQQDADAIFDRMFDSKGKWRISIANWAGNPQDSLEQSEFFDVFLSCLKQLPLHMGDAFTLRFLDQFDAEAISKQLQFTKNHVLVLLHRGRVRMWRCLTLKWFKPE